MLRFVAVTIFMVICQVGFGVYPVMIKYFACNLNPLVLSMWRDALCAPLLFVAATLFEGLHAPKSWRDGLIFVFLGLLGMFMNQLFFILGVSYAGAALASMMQPLIPIFTFAFSMSTRIEPYTLLTKGRGRYRVLAILLAVGGAVVMTMGSNASLFGLDGHHHHSESNSSSAPSPQLLTATPEPAKCAETSHGKVYLLGVIFLLINTLMMSVFVVVQKALIFGAGWKIPPRAEPAPHHRRTTSTGGEVAPLLEVGCGEPFKARHVWGTFFAGIAEAGARWKDRPVSVTAWAYIAGAFFMLVATGVEALASHLSADTLLLRGEAVGVPEWHNTYGGWIVVAYAVAISSGLCYTLITLSTRLVVPSAVTFFWPVQVPVAIFGSYLVLPGSPVPNLPEIIGCVGVAIGTVVLSVVNVRDELAEKRGAGLPSAGQLLPAQGYGSDGSDDEQGAVQVH